MGPLIVVIGVPLTVAWGWWKLAGSLKAADKGAIERHVTAGLLAWLAGIGVMGIAAGLFPGDGEDVAVDIGMAIFFSLWMTPLLFVIHGTRKKVRAAGNEARLAASESFWAFLRPTLAKSLADYKAEVKKQEENRIARIRQEQPDYPDYPVDDSLTANDGVLHFEYQDFWGNESVRSVSDWYYDGECITGMCATRGEERSFRHDRILDFISGEELLDPHLVDDEPRVHFEGFDPEEREELEELIEGEGWQLRRYISRDLTHICVGPDPDPSVIDAAEEIGAKVINKKQMERLLDEQGVRIY